MPSLPSAGSSWLHICALTLSSFEQKVEPTPPCPPPPGRTEAGKHRSPLPFPPRRPHPTGSSSYKVEYTRYTGTLYLPYHHRVYVRKAGREGRRRYGLTFGRELGRGKNTSQQTNNSPPRTSFISAFSEHCGFCQKRVNDAGGKVRSPSEKSSSSEWISPSVIDGQTERKGRRKRVDELRRRRTATHHPLPSLLLSLLIPQTFHGAGSKGKILLVRFGKVGERSSKSDFVFCRGGRETLVVP